MHSAVIVSTFVCLVLLFASCPAVAQTCPAYCTEDSECNGRGKCVEGTCQCITPYTNTYSEGRCSPCSGCETGYDTVLRNDSDQIECIKPQICSVSDCGPNALNCVPLTDYEGSFQCICKTGWIAPTLNGSCSECAPGFTRDPAGNCVLDPSNDPCMQDNTNPCSKINNSVCVFDVTGITCRCKTGFVQSSTGACVPVPTDCNQVDWCGHGTCESGRDGITCKCQEGYTHGVTVVVDPTTGAKSTSLKFCAFCDIANGYVQHEESGNCTKIDDDCDGIVCLNGGMCLDGHCRCPFNFNGSQCEACADGYIDAPSSIGSLDGKCRACAEGFHPVGTRCVSDEFDKCENCNHGTCVNITVNSREIKTCKCEPGWTHHPIKGYCSVCEDITASPNNNCVRPNDTETAFATCTQNCREANLDDNAICILVSHENGLAPVGKCGCDPKYKMDKNGRCTLCAEGYYPSVSSLGKLVCEPRCPGGCNRGLCVPDQESSDGLILNYKCLCPDGYNGTNCEQVVDFSNEITCSPSCVGPEVCVRSETRYISEYSIVGTASPSIVTFKCACPPNFEDAVDPATGAKIRCGKCREGWTGTQCQILVNGTCQCMDGWTGEFCHVPRNPCDIYRDRCPRGTKCVPDKNDGFQCVCDGSRTGVNCSLDLCSEKNCDFSKGFICNNEGKCVCPLSLVLADSGTSCRPRYTSPDGNTCSDNKPCFVPPIKRNITITSANNSFTIEAQNTTNNAIDLFTVNTIPTAMGICVGRTLKMETADKSYSTIVNFTGCLQLLSVYAHEWNNTANIVHSIDYYGQSPAVTDLQQNNDDQGTLVQIALNPWDQIVQLVCYVVDKPRSTDTVVINPSSLKCGFKINVPFYWYAETDARICLRSKVYVHSPSTTTLSPQSDKAYIKLHVPGNGFHATLALDNHSLIGDNKVQILNTFVQQNGEIFVDSCIMAHKPDIIWIDPEFSTADSSYSPDGIQSTQPNPFGVSSTASAAVLSIATLIAVVAFAALF